MLWLIRHAHAVTPAEDPLRPLSAQGRAQVAQLAAFFRANRAVNPAEFWHSPLVRARETAALLAAGLGSAAPLVETPGLAPEDDPHPLAAHLAGLAPDLAIVGHEPHLGQLATLLVAGRIAPVAFALKKGACLALAAESGGWCVHWQISPGLLGFAPGSSPVPGEI